MTRTSAVLVRGGALWWRQMLNHIAASPFGLG